MQNNPKYNNGPGRAPPAAPSVVPNPPKSRIPGPPPARCDPPAAPASPPVPETPSDTASHRLSCSSFGASLPPPLQRATPAYPSYLRCPRKQGHFSIHCVRTDPTGSDYLVGCIPTCGEPHGLFDVVHCGAFSWPRDLQGRILPFCAPSRHSSSGSDVTRTGVRFQSESAFGFSQNMHLPEVPRV